MKGCKEHNIKVSVIMPVFNTATFLPKTIESFQNQTLKEIELICVDDGSSDNSVDIIENYASKDSRIKIIKQSHVGVSRARNIALEHVNAPYVYPLDSDDYLSSDAIELAYTKITETNADVVLSDLIFILPDKTVINSVIGIRGNRNVIISGKEAVELSLDWTIHSLGLWNVDLLRKIKYDEIGMNGDELTFRLLYLNSSKVAFSAGSYFYIQHNASTTKKLSIKLFDTLVTNERMLKVLEENDFDKSVIQKFLIKSFDHLIGRNAILLLNKKQFSSFDCKIAKQKIKESFHRMDKKKLKQAIKDTNSSQKKLQLSLLIANFTIFNWGCYYLFRYKQKNN